MRRSDPCADDYRVFDTPQVSAAFVRQQQGPQCEATLLVDGIRCANCSLTIEKALHGLAGVVDVQVNPSTRHALLRWDSSTVRLSRLMGEIAALGFTPHPYQQQAAAQRNRAEFHAALKRLAVAGLGMMQVMTFAVATYAGALEGISDTFSHFFRLLALLVTTPVVFYSAAVFFRAAVRDLSRGRAGMDVPVALAIGIAFTASAAIVLFGELHTEVYFDSVVMFTFFLSCGRFLEMVARHRSQAATDALGGTLPAVALHLVDSTDGRTETRPVPLSAVSVGDRLLVRPGDTVPADGIVCSGESAVDESLITGESTPVRKGDGDKLVAASLNLHAPLQLRVTRTGADTLICGIARLLERARGERPPGTQLADAIAGRFVAGVLVLAACVGAAWIAIEPAQALAVTLSVLVVTCPCALSLATPAAMTAAIGALSRQGVLVTRGAALENLARVGTLLLDKTGTLTTGSFAVVAVHRFDRMLSQRDCLALAATLESGSAHPLASAFDGYAGNADISDIQTRPGQGIEASIDGARYRIGNRRFVTGLAAAGAQPERPPAEVSQARTVVYLGNERGLLAAFTLADALRADAVVAVRELRERGLSLGILSGDAEPAVAYAAATLEIDDFESGLLPAQKLQSLRRRRVGSEPIAMLGDGINDAPVLGGADVSIAMGSGAALAQASADLILPGGSLRRVVAAVDMARAARRVVRQNIAWAIAYNALALPLAATGQLAPWVAAIGMSASSVVVVLNAMRLGRSDRSAERSAAEVPVAHPVSPGA